MGYAYANIWRTKPAYKHTVESTLYVKHDAFGKKIGSQLYSKLFHRLKEQGIKVVIGGLSLPNDESIGLHKKFGLNTTEQKLINIYQRLSIHNHIYIIIDQDYKGYKKL